MLKIMLPGVGFHTCCLAGDPIHVFLDHLCKEVHFMNKPAVLSLTC